MPDTLSTIALILSIVGTFAATYSALKAHQAIQLQKYVTAVTSVGTVAVELSKLLCNPKLLEFHNISEKDLKQYGISADELSYIVANLTMGETYYRIEAKEGQPISLTEYRKNFISHPNFAPVWKHLIKGNLLSCNSYTDAIDNFLDEKEGLPDTIINNISKT